MVTNLSIVDGSES